MMSFEHWRPVWDRVRSGKHTIVIGTNDVPSAPTDLHVLRVSCATPLGTRGPLHEIQRRMDHLLGTDSPDAPTSLRQTHSRPPRFHLLEETPGRAFASTFVETCNRLADWDGGRAALCFTALDAADQATSNTLTEILSRPQWLRLPLILLIRETEADTGTASKLIDAVRSHAGAESIVEIPTDEAGDTTAFNWPTLAPETLQILRAGAVIGLRFEAELIARLLDKSMATVLEQLQYAKDAGAPVTDQGHGYFVLTSTAVTELRDQLLPSLLSFWHQRLGTLLAEHSPMTEQFEAIDDAGRQEDATPAQKISESVPAQSNFAELFEPASPLTAEESPKDTEAVVSGPVTEQARTPEPRSSSFTEQSSSPAAPQVDQARAAAHLENAGQTEAAAQQFLAAVRELAARGDAQRAYLLAQQALQLLGKLPDSDRRALLRAELLLEAGQIQWQSYAHDTHFTLAQSLESLRAASAALPAEPPAEILGRLATATAGVCYELGDLQSLECALSELTEASRRLMAAGVPLQAACLLSDQAAIYVRLGDPVQATHLLNKAMQLFGQLLAQKSNESLALAELAQVYHLLARLPLHARIRSGRDQDACTMGLEHATRAENNYRQLDWRRELGRVWETMGRLEMRRGRAEIAHGRLTSALTLQRQLVDITGLARSSAALAECFAMLGQIEQALALLADSIALNNEKGSPIGLAFNRHTLSALAAGIKQHGAEAGAVHEPLAVLERQLAEAEAKFGRVTLPAFDASGR